MLKERTEFIRSVLYVAELFAISAVFFSLYFFLHFKTALYHADLVPGVEVIPQPRSIDLYLRAYWLVLVLWAIILRVRGEYRNLRIQTYGKVLANYLVNGLLFFGFFTSIAFIFQFQFLSRFFIGVYTLLTTVVLMIGRMIVLFVAYQIRKKGYNYRNLLLIGTGRRAQEFLSLIARHHEWGYRVIGLLDMDPAMTGKKIAGYSVMGTVENLPRLLEENIVDEVVIVVPRDWLKEMERCILYCEAVGIPTTLSTDFFDLEIAYGVPKEMDGFTYLTFETSRLRDPELFLKRLIDIVFSGAALILLTPVFLIVSLAVKISSPEGPVFFKQLRSGRNGRKFLLYKFRSMVPDAEKRLDALQTQNEMSGPVFKMKNDPRLTKIGWFIRNTSLDEIPQFWNVFKGDMSLVGPRPPIPVEVEKYQTWQRRRLSMKPGITCIWQVSGRNNIDFENWMRLDLQYIDRWSLWLDIKILLLTIRAVLSRSGAR